jgi:hypothetical protein
MTRWTRLSGGETLRRPACRPCLEACKNPDAGTLLERSRQHAFSITAMTSHDHRNGAATRSLHR